jgi:hypothetical protein
MLDYFLLKNFSKPVTVGECLGDPPENWYRAAGGAPNASLLVSYRMIQTTFGTSCLQISAAQEEER